MKHKTVFRIFVELLQFIFLKIIFTGKANKNKMMMLEMLKFLLLLRHNFPSVKYFFMLRVKNFSPYKLLFRIGSKL